MRSSVDRMAYVALVAILIMVLTGGLVLLNWLRKRRPGSRFPARLVVSHVGSAAVAVVLWGGYLVSGRVALAWIAFAVLNLTNALGDAILTRRWRALAGAGPSWIRDYGRAVMSVLRGQRPPVALVHGGMAGVTFLLTLIACIAGT
jgi:hypothetical protein